MKHKKAKRTHAQTEITERKVKKKHMRPPTLKPAGSRPDVMIRPTDWGALISQCLCRLDTRQSKLIEVTNKHAITKAVLIFAPGIDVDCFLDSEAGSRPQTIKTNEYPSLEQFELVWPTKGPVAKKVPISIVDSVVKQSVTKSERQQILRMAELAEKKSVPLAKFEDLLLDKETMAVLDYPLTPKDEDWIELPDIRSRDLPIRKEDLWAVDCEMVVTEGGQRELAQIAVTDSNYKELYKVYVKPAKRVVDYKYEYSGITAELLESATDTLSDVQTWFKNNIKPSTVLVGHSLNFDLNVMKIVYHNVIDTSVIYSHQGDSRKMPSLRWLSQFHLKKVIQEGTNGHDPAIDANTAMELVLRKHLKGQHFGKDRFGTNLAKMLLEEGKTTAIVGHSTELWAEGCAKTMRVCKSDDEVVGATVELAQTHDLTVCRLEALENGGQDVSTGDEVKTTMDAQIGQIVDSVPANTLIVVFTEHGNVGGLGKLLERAKIDSEFSVEDAMDLKRVSERAIVSATFATIKIC